MSTSICPSSRRTKTLAVTYSDPGMNNIPTPTDIRLRTKSRVLTVSFDSGEVFDLPFEYLRVRSPSAEVRGHGAGQEVLQHGKRDVTVTSVEPIGHYAVRLLFDDGHDSGLYTWQYLYELGNRQAEYWQTYLDQLQAAGYSREPSATG